MKKHVRAIIIEDGRLLLLKREKPGVPVYWVFPGGKVEENDGSLEKALERECKEELGVDIIVQEFFDTDLYEAEVHYFYRAEVVGGKLGSGTGPEYDSGSGYIGKYTPEWVEINKIADGRIFPEEIVKKLLGKMS